MASEIPTIIFYDLDHILQPSSRSWSCNTIRTAAALKWRKLKHSRQPVSYPDILPLLSAAGVPETGPQYRIKYTLPAISLHYSDGREKYMMNSDVIADALEKLVPIGAEHPSLFPEGEKTKEQLAIIEKAMDQSDDILATYIVPWIALILDPGSIEYFNRTREPGFKMPLAEMRARHAEEDLLPLLKTGLTFIAQAYVDSLPTESGGSQAAGPFMGGRAEPSYPDFAVAGNIEWYRCARGDEIVNKAMEEVHGGILTHVMRRLDPLLRE